MIYEYKCKVCGYGFDVSASVTEKAAGIAPACPSCGSKETAQVFASIGAFRMQGSAKSKPGPSGGCGPGCGCCGLSGEG